MTTMLFNMAGMIKRHSIRQAVSLEQLANFDERSFVGW